jgi:hypothetical protein
MAPPARTSTLPKAMVDMLTVQVGEPAIAAAEAATHTTAASAGWHIHRTKGWHIGRLRSRKTSSIFC